MVLVVSHVFALVPLTAGFENWVIRNVSILKAQMKTMQETLDAILQSNSNDIGRSHFPGTDQAPCANNEINLPIKSKELWLELEQKASEPRIKSWLVCEEFCAINISSIIPNYLSKTW